MICRKIFHRIWPAFAKNRAIQARDRRCSLVLEPLESRRLLATQVFTPQPEQVFVPEGAAQFDVVYTALDDTGSQDDTIKTTGVTLRMHYNSSEILPDIASISSNAFPGATIQDTIDNSDADGNSNTDRLVNFLWFDFQGSFPQGANLPLVLFTADFDAVGDFADSTSVNFSGAPPIGFEFQATSATLNFGVVNQNPVINSSATVSVRENQSFAIDVNATDADGDTLTFVMAGGADRDVFSINASTGVISFITAPDFVNPSDTGSDNVYDVQVTVSDGRGGEVSQDISITVTNAAWINPRNIFDVNDLDGVTPLDVLLIINELTRQDVHDPTTKLLLPRPPEGFAPPYYDVSGDGKITPLDILRVINRLTSISSEQVVAGEHLVTRSRESEQASTNSDVNLSVRESPITLFDRTLRVGFTEVRSGLADTASTESEFDSALETFADEVARQWFGEVDQTRFARGQ